MNVRPCCEKLNQVRFDQLTALQYIRFLDISPGSSSSCHLNGLFHIWESMASIYPQCSFGSLVCL